ncbi:MAG TPA: ATP-grasp domain-containing protein [Saprospiraceae bacterium]|nr:ATP-grasp domain-containing protein [Saprospiraceae bacterium]HMP23453.1 ATP-grasp domain-containing protein [Saprospiraceae bacterium]
MRFVLFVARNFTENAVRFIRAFAGLPGVRVGLLAEEPVHLLPADLQQQLATHRQLVSVYDVPALVAAAETLAQNFGPVHRIIGAVEQLQETIATVRERMGIAGMDVATALNFRDKARMKNLLRQAGIPCARYALVTNIGMASAFAKEVGFPLIVKPPDGAGSRSTFKVRSSATMGQALQLLGLSPECPVLLEEFVLGSEHSFDTFSLRGQHLFHSISHYYPSPLEVMQEPWIQWQVVLPIEVDTPQYDDIRHHAFRTLDVLGMQTGFSHLEWFRRKDGSLAISEVAARPPGAQFPTLISRANDFDALSAWARLMVLDEFTLPKRKYAVGAAYLRGQGEGRVVAIHGIEELDKTIGHLVTDVKLPQIGQEALPSYEGEGYIIVRHPKTEVVRAALQQIVSIARVELG